MGVALSLHKGAKFNCYKHRGSKFTVFKMAADGKVLTPQVQWAQRKHMIILRVLVQPVEVTDCREVLTCLHKPHTIET